MRKIIQIIPLFLMGIFFIISCEKNDESETTDPNNSETFDCISGDCVTSDGIGLYSNLSDCQSNCMDGAGKFDCINGDCIIAGSNGAFSSLSDCLSTCGVAAQSPCNGLTSVSWGGHTYQLVEIGSQCWFAENLQYSGNIPKASTRVEWASIWNYGNETQQPAWCYYDDDPANGPIYGKLYNWYAVNTGSLCPSGWHIPTQAEWIELTVNLGGQNLAGGKLKSTTGWNSPNTGATNISGFSGLPGGSRNEGGYFNYSLLKSGNWWTSTSETNPPHYANYRYLKYNNANIAGTAHMKVNGYSCRCIKD